MLCYFRVQAPPQASSVQRHIAAQPQRPAGRPCAVRSALPLAALPPDALHTVLRCLSAQDLTTLARVSRALRAAASDETLWRRLYYARWGTFSGGEDKIMGASFWKVPCHRPPYECVGAVTRAPAEDAACCVHAAHARTARVHQARDVQGWLHAV